MIDWHEVSCPYSYSPELLVGMNKFLFASSIVYPVHTHEEQRKRRFLNCNKLEKTYF